MGLDEIKLSPAEANLYFYFDGYISLFSIREKNGEKEGGVAILVKSSLQFTQDLNFVVSIVNYWLLGPKVKKFI